MRSRLIKCLGGKSERDRKGNVALVSPTFLRMLLGSYPAKPACSKQHELQSQTKAELQSTRIKQTSNRMKGKLLTTTWLEEKWRLRLVRVGSGIKGEGKSNLIVCHKTNASHRTEIRGPYLLDGLQSLTIQRLLN